MNLLDLLFPKKCVGCRVSASFFFFSCLAQLVKVRDVCPVCAKPALFGQTHFNCQTKYSLDGLLSGFYYQGVLRKAIHRFKYKPYLEDLAFIFAQLLLPLLQNQPKIKTFLTQAVLTPVPLHWWRQHLRGYNQTWLLACHLGKGLGISVVDLLIRTKPTKPQASLSFTSRLKNVANSFKVKTKPPLKVLLVDDVWTTGATLKNCCRVLKKAGAYQVWAITLAR